MAAERGGPLPTERGEGVGRYCGGGVGIKDLNVRPGIVFQEGCVYFVRTEPMNSLQWQGGEKVPCQRAINNGQGQGDLVSDNRTVSQRLVAIHAALDAHQCHSPAPRAAWIALDAGEWQRREGVRCQRREVRE